MPHSTRGTVVLMGSGEMSASMVEVHKYAMSLVEGPVRAAFIDTPAGFQLNADLIGEKAVAYFAERLQTELKVVSFKSARDASVEEIQAAVEALHEATYLFAGPGSPTYALRNWRNTPILDAMFETLTHGGCLSFASAAALTLGRLTLPVYEIYKVGEMPCWVEGLNILGHSGLEVCVVPHWNNKSGGDHDTRFCFAGEPRWNDLEVQLPQSTRVLGLDEHTACILRLAEGVCEVRGIGQARVRWAGEEQVFAEGDTFALDLLRPDAEEEASPPLEHGLPSGSGPLSWSALQAQHEALIRAGKPDSSEVTAYIYDLMAFMSAARERQDWRTMQQAEEALREALVNVVAELNHASPNPSHLIAPYVDLLIKVRRDLREAKQWQAADLIREGLGQLQIAVEDNAEGTSWRYVGDGGESAG